LHFFISKRYTWSPSTYLCESGINAVFPIICPPPISSLGITKFHLFKRSLSYGVDLCVRIVRFLFTVPISVMIYLPVFSFFLLLSAVKFATSFIVIFLLLG